MLEELEDATEAVAARILRVRQIKGLTKKDFAQTLMMSPQAYGDYENGRRDLPLTVAKRLRKTYQIPLEFTYFGKTDDLPQRIASALSSRHMDKPV